MSASNLTMEAYEDPDHPYNGPEYHTGKKCIERGCTYPAGTKWSPLWCQAHNAERIKRIDGSMESLVSRMTEKGKSR